MFVPHAIVQTEPNNTTLLITFMPETDENTTSHPLWTAPTQLPSQRQLFSFLCVEFASFKLIWKVEKSLLRLFTSLVQNHYSLTKTSFAVQHPLRCTTCSDTDPNCLLRLASFYKFRVSPFSLYLPPLFSTSLLRRRFCGFLSTRLVILAASQFNSSTGPCHHHHRNIQFSIIEISIRNWVVR